MAKIADSVKKKVPELRFKGFTDDWEERKLGDFIDVKSGKDYKHLNSGSIPVYGTGGYMLSVDRALSDIDAIGIGRKGTIDKPYLLKAPFWTVDTLFYAVPKQNIDLQFSLSIFKKINWKKFDESTGVPSLSKTVINSVGASVPSYEEQQKIGSFFKQLDKTIALHQRKLDLLKEQKKGYLQKMFPKKGAKVPELRFAGFADAWEQRKLSEIADHRGGTAIEKYFEKDGKYRVISIGSYGLDSQYIDQNIRALSNEVTDERVVHAGELTMVLNDKTTNGTIIGRSLLIDQDNKYVINQRTEIISPKEKFDSDFAYAVLNGPFREKVKRIVQGGTQIYVNYPAVSNLNVEIPNIDEQQKIGSFFKQLDETIALHQRKLDLLKEQKKGFLQKMFV
ncbi:restriction endonuclease subunit S [Lactobacillus helveticus]|uniref:restriction endonuclease subunit S n=1 Tax=Lactobacillus helveticus TaxID=1587 RepID=UPI002181F940|nr:restriction endonuclease subunit S [Lactobacillus helveticus]MCS8611407.1 restriction endonuclease subunit S [Lactobacillus helveticus]MCT3409715.1 restriction endonuclease subunit S [Lactobacillus helveticus]MCT3431149.1 restriction endonuclease subunit S [Lactobacillus helveticus]MCT3433327.1 restriction endonuclease subunit S [Lactobacillus helveticus]